MKGYNVEAGFMGFVDGDYILFANEADYTAYYAGAVEDLKVLRKHDLEVAFA